MSSAARWIGWNTNGFRLESGAVRGFQRIGLVRFNPFEDTGGNQSFASPLLDAEGNGWVLSACTRARAPGCTRKSHP
jgi:hypothetical protein